MIVGVRQDTSTYRQYAGVVLLADNSNMLHVTEGFAHGFLSQRRMLEYVNRCLRSSHWTRQEVSGGMMTRYFKSAGLQI